MGIPVICDEKSFAKDVSGQELADIENPYYVGLRTVVVQSSLPTVHT